MTSGRSRLIGAGSVGGRHVTGGQLIVGLVLRSPVFKTLGLRLGTGPVAVTNTLLTVRGHGLFNVIGRTGDVLQIIGGGVCILFPGEMWLIGTNALYLGIGRGIITGVLGVGAPILFPWTEATAVNVGMAPGIATMVGTRGGDMFII